MEIHFAPLQGYTDRPYRMAHAQQIGGVAVYYTPFLRLEHGTLRNKDLRDLQQMAEEPCLVPQIIAKDADEMARLCDLLQTNGIRQIDINMGCPFPLQVRQGRGSGLLTHTDRVQALLDEAARRPDCQFSVKMRLGWDNIEECFALLPLLNGSCLQHITLHPRLGTQQYKGLADIEAFHRFYHQCHKPLLYNGDIATPEQARKIADRFPALAGIMIGRGLLARPTLANEIAHGSLPEADRHRATLLLHEEVDRHATAYLQGDSQILSRLHAFWEYQEATLPKKNYKALMKSGSLRSYNEALNLWRRTCTEE